MVIYHASLLSQNTDISIIQTRIPIIKLEKMSFSRLQVYLKNSSTSSNPQGVENGLATHLGRRRRRRRRRRGHHPLTFDTIRRYKTEMKSRTRLIEERSEHRPLNIEIKPLEDIQHFQSETIHSINQELDEVQLRRKTYNEQQTSLIPLIMDDECLSSLRSMTSSSQDHLLFDILTLLNNMEEDYLSNNLESR